MTTRHLEPWTSRRPGSIALALLLTFGLLAAAGLRQGSGTNVADAACTAADSRIAFAVNTGSGYELFAVNPDGSCVVQLTSGDTARSVYAWTDDNHVLVRNVAGTTRLLAVPDSTDAATVGTVFSSSREFEDISQHENSSGVLPVSQQLYVGLASDGLNIEVCTTDGTSCTQLTNYVNTYTPGGTGTEYVVRSPEWLVPSGDLSRMRLAYHYARADFVDGEMTTYEEGLRAVSLDTSTWPTVSTSGMTDKWIQGKDETLGGYPFGAYSDPEFSRDGSTAAVRGPQGDGIYIVPVSYDDSTETVTMEIADASHIATQVSESIMNDLSLSPDNSRIGYNASTLVGRGGNRRVVDSVFVIGTDAQSGSVEVDGQTGDYACCTVWGPSASTGSATSTPAPTNTPTDEPAGPTATPTDEPGGAATAHIGDLDGTAMDNGSRWKVSIAIVVHDDDDAPVSGATVSGSWIEGASGAAGCTTDASGACTVTSGNVKKNEGTITFVVTDVSHASLAYSSADNHDPDGDSDGTTISVNKP